MSPRRDKEQAPPSPNYSHQGKVEGKKKSPKVKGSEASAPAYLGWSLWLLFPPLLLDPPTPYCSRSGFTPPEVLLLPEMSPATQTHNKQTLEGPDSMLLEGGRLSRALAERGRRGSSIASPTHLGGCWHGPEDRKVQHGGKKDFR